MSTFKVFASILFFGCVGIFGTLYWEEISLPNVAGESSVEFNRSLGDVNLAEVVANKEDLLLNFINIYGEEVILGKLQEELGHENCHFLAHIVGQVAYDARGDAPFVGIKNQHVCQFGYMHGQIERWVADVGYTQSAAITTGSCDFFNTRLDKVLCSHGIGHGFMILAAYDPLEAINGCSTFSERILRTHCYSGVFMEQMIARTERAQQGENLSDLTGVKIASGDSLCGGFKFNDDVLGKCYLMHAYELILTEGLTFEEAAQRCGLVADVHSCIQGVGYFFSADSKEPPDAAYMASLCMSLIKPSYIEHCATGVVQIYLLFWGLSETTTAADFCRYVQNEQARRTCSQALGFLLGENSIDLGGKI